MRDLIEQEFVQALKNHPEVLNAAITGSQAQQTSADQFSDLDVLLVARDMKAVTDVAAWLQGSEHVLICAFHLSNYCTVLLNGFQNIDLAIFSHDDPSSRWVVQDYEVTKGGEDFEAQLAAAAKVTRNTTAAHLNPRQRVSCSLNRRWASTNVGPAMPPSVKLDVFGKRMFVEWHDGAWRTFLLGADGKRSAVNVAIPQTVSEAELVQYFDDIYHEAATPQHPTVMRLS